MSYAAGDLVVARVGEYEGKAGYVIAVDTEATEAGEENVYQCMFSNEKMQGVFDFLAESELIKAEVEEDDLEIPEDVPSPRFGMGAHEFEGHVRYLLTKSLGRITQVGPEEAFFGFQPFEELTAPEVLSELMVKVEEGMALFAQAHILIGRVIMAYQVQEVPNE